MRRAFITVVFVALVLLADTAAAQEKTDIAAADRAVQLSLGILVDCSGSQRLQFEKVLAMAKKAAAMVGSEDEAFLVKFVSAEKISIVEEFSSDKKVLADAVDDLFIEGGQTSVLDAMSFSIRYFSEGRSAAGAQRAIVLITDGDDRDSTTRADAVLKALKEQNIKVFAVGIGDEKVNAKLLERLAKESGGRTYLPRSVADIDLAAADIFSALSKQPSK